MSADGFQRKGDELLRRATAARSEQERRRLIAEAAEWHARAAEMQTRSAEGPDASAPTDDLTEREA